MKRAAFFLLLYCHLAATFAGAAFYQWTDAEGVVHLTDDRDKIPGAYKERAKEIELDPTLPPARGASPAPQPSPPQPRAKAPTPGGHGERWWRQRVAAVRTELKILRDARAQKEERLVRLRRERTIFQRARDRQAINALQVEISADESRISTLLNQLQLLEAEAGREGVPAEWLR